MFLTLNLKLHFDGEDAEEVLNLGDRKNSRKRRDQQQLREEAKNRKEKTRPNGSPPLKVLFPPFCGLSEKGFFEISPSQPTKSLLLEELLFFSCS